MGDALLGDVRTLPNFNEAKCYIAYEINPATLISIMLWNTPSC